MPPTDPPDLERHRSYLQLLARMNLDPHQDVLLRPGAAATSTAVPQSRSWPPGHGRSSCASSATASGTPCAPAATWAANSPHRPTPSRPLASGREALIETAWSDALSRREADLARQEAEDLIGKTDAR